MKTVDQIRHHVIVLRLDSLQREYDEAMARLTDQKQRVDWINAEMAELWLEKAALERCSCPEFKKFT